MLNLNDYEAVPADGLPEDAPCVFIHQYHNHIDLKELYRHSKRSHALLRRRNDVRRYTRPFIEKCWYPTVDFYIHAMLDDKEFIVNRFKLRGVRVKFDNA